MTTIRKTSRGQTHVSDVNASTAGSVTPSNGGAAKLQEGSLWINEATDRVWVYKSATEPIELATAAQQDTLEPVLNTTGPTETDDDGPVGRLWVNTSTGQAWLCVSAVASNAVWTPIPRRTVKTSTQTTTSASLQSDNDLSFSVKANRRYSFRFGVLFQSDDVNTGIALALNLSGSVSVFGATSQIPESGSMATGFHTASDDERVGGSVAAADTDYYATLEGIIEPSADGTVTLRFRSSDSGVEVRMRRGSFVEWTEHYT